MRRKRSFNVYVNNFLLRLLFVLQEKIKTNNNKVHLHETFSLSKLASESSASRQRIRVARKFSL